MNIASVKSSNNFKGVNYEYLSTVDRERCIRGNMQWLNAIGKNYDLRFVSLYVPDPNATVVDIDVRPLKKGLNFFQKLFRPMGRSCFESGYISKVSNKLHIKEGFKNAVLEAVADLDRKTKLHK